MPARLLLQTVSGRFRLGPDIVAGSTTVVIIKPRSGILQGGKPVYQQAEVWERGTTPHTPCICATCSGDTGGGIISRRRRGTSAIFWIGPRHRFLIQPQPVATDLTRPAMP